MRPDSLVGVPAHIGLLESAPKSHSGMHASVVEAAIFARVEIAPRRNGRLVFLRNKRTLSFDRKDGFEWRLGSRGHLVAQGRTSLHLVAVAAKLLCVEGVKSLAEKKLGCRFEGTRRGESPKPSCRMSHRSSHVRTYKSFQGRR